MFMNCAYRCSVHVTFALPHPFSSLVHAHIHLLTHLSSSRPSESLSHISRIWQPQLYPNLPWVHLLQLSPLFWKPLTTHAWQPPGTNKRQVPNAPPSACSSIHCYQAVTLLDVSTVCFHSWSIQRILWVLIKHLTSQCRLLFKKKSSAYWFKNLFKLSPN